MKSWGVGDTDALGFISVKGITYFPNIPAHNLALITIKSFNHNLQCVEPASHIFEVNSPAGAQDFLSYVLSLPHGTVVVGASAGSVSGQVVILAEAFDLMGMDVGLIDASSSLTFYAMVGHKGFALQRVAPGGSGPNYLYADLSRTQTGMHCKAITTRGVTRSYCRIWYDIISI